MKITCHACDAKYTIADEKVSGRTVKIKCKKCGATIVVNADPAAAAAPMGAPAGYPEPAPPAEDDSMMATRVAGQDGAPPAITAAEWTVSLGEEERQMSQLQIAEEMQRGTITGDTYVWKDGMSDWLSVAQVPELAALLARYVPAAAAPAPAPYAPPAAPVQDEPHMGLAGTVVMSESPVISPLAAAAPRPAAGMPAAEAPAPAGLAPVNQPTTAARRANRPAGGSVDVFAAAAEKQVERPKPPTPAGRLGERNENSVLFSLSALTATESAAAKGAAPEVADLGLGSSNGKSAVDDLMSLGGGAIGGPMLAPPPLLAPVVEPPPAPVPVAASVPPAAAMPSMAPGANAFEPMAPPKKSKTGLIIGIVAGVLVLGGVGAFVATSGGDEASGEAGATTASTSAAPAATSAAPTPAATTSSAPTAEPTASDAPAASGTPVASNDASGHGSSSSGGSAGPASTKGGAGTATSSKPTSEPVASAPTTTSSSAPAPDPGAATGRDFNKGAATAALAAAAGAAKGCKQPGGPTGSASVRVVFAPSGNVTSANVQGPPFAGTPVGGCIASAFRGAHVPPFDGSPVAVSKTVNIN